MLITCNIDIRTHQPCTVQLSSVGDLYTVIAQKEKVRKEDLQTDSRHSKKDHIDPR